MKSGKVNRRNFLSKSTAVIAGVGVSSLPGNLIYQENNVPKVKGFRMLGRTGFRVSDIGCGPAAMTDENLLRAVLDTGVNIIDTAEFYGNGNNEILVGKGIKGIKRESLFINTKLQIAESNKSEDIVARVRKCLERMNTGYLDGMMLWNPATREQLKNKEFHKAFVQLNGEGRVRYCGISCHGTEFPNPDGSRENMEQVVGGAIEDGRFDHVLFIYNYVQQDMGRNILKACAERNIGATLMKTDPFGGALITMSEQRIKAMKETNTPIPENLKRPYELITERQKKGEEYLARMGFSDPSFRRKAAMAFVLDNPAVSTAFVTFMSFDQIEPYISLSGIKLNAGTSENIEMLKNNYGHLYCRHACGICESICPHGIPVNTIMRYHHYFLGQRREKYAMQKYNELHGPKLEKCADCSGICESACPYGVSIRALIASAHQDLTLVPEQVC